MKVVLVVYLFFFCALVGAIDHPSLVVEQVIAGSTNATGPSLGFKMSDSEVTADTNYTGFSVGLAVTFVYDWNMWVAAGVPKNATVPPRASIAYSTKGHEFASLVNSMDACPVATSVAFGQGRAVIGCSDSYNVFFDEVLDVNSARGSNDFVTSSNRMQSVQGISTNLFAGVKAVAYSEHLSRFVAVGKFEQAVNSAVSSTIGYSDDGLTWVKVTDVDNVENNYMTDVVYAEDIGFVLTGMPYPNADTIPEPGILLSANGIDGYAPVPTMANPPTTAGKIFSSVTYANSAQTWYAFTLDGPTASGKRQAGPQLINFFAGSDQGAVQKVPPLVNEDVPLNSVSAVRFLPLRDVLFVGGFNRVGDGRPDGSLINALEICETPENCQPTTVHMVVEEKRVVMGGGPSPGSGGTGSTNFNQTGGLLTIFGAAAPQIVKANVVSGGVANFDMQASLINGTVVVESGETFTVEGSVNITLPKPYFQQMGSMHVEGGQLYLGNGSSLVCDTNLELRAASLSVVQGHKLQAKNMLLLQNGATLVVEPQLSFNQSGPLTIEIATYASLRGTFASVTLAQSRKRSVLTENGVTCTSSAGTASVNYGSQSLTVTTTISSSCSDGSGSGSGNGNGNGNGNGTPVELSTGAIVGIAIGAVVVGVAAVIGIVVVTKILIAKHTAAANQQIAAKEMYQLD